MASERVPSTDAGPVPFPHYQAIFKYIAACQACRRMARPFLGWPADSAVERSDAEAVGAAGDQGGVL